MINRPGSAVRLEVAFPGGRGVASRRVLVHMIEETARHAGQPDLSREMTDGLTGE